jgi:ArsR family transcriptional regulator
VLPEVAACDAGGIGFLPGRYRDAETKMNSIIWRFAYGPFRPLKREPHGIFELIGRQEQIDQAARAIKAMAHPLRLKILCVLGNDEVSVQDIVDAVGTSQSNISQHLAILREKGVLRARKDANRVFYRVGDQRTLALIGMMREVFCGMPQGK